MNHTVPALNGGNHSWSSIRDLTKLKRYYAKRFRDATAVAVFLGKDFARRCRRRKIVNDFWRRAG